MLARPLCPKVAAGTNAHKVIHTKNHPIHPCGMDLPDPARPTFVRLLSLEDLSLGFNTRGSLRVNIFNTSHELLRPDASQTDIKSEIPLL